MLRQDNSAFHSRARAADGPRPMWKTFTPTVGPAHTGSIMGFSGGMLVGIAICVVIAGWIIWKALRAFWNSF